MLAHRLTTALETGAVTLPEAGRIAVIAPHEGEDLSALPKDRVEVVTRLFPVHRAFAQAGYATAVAPTGPYALSIVCLPRAKAEARAAIAEAARATEGPLVIDGQKTDGVDSILKDLRRRAETGPALSKAHGKLFTLAGGDFADWLPQAATAQGFTTLPGTFSADGIDPGSAALAAALPARMKGTAVDLGAGWGYLSAELLKREGLTSVDLVEADHAALEAARLNVTDPRARFHWADARDFRAGAPVDHVVTNPPFHQSRAADPGLGQAFIRAAAAMLKPSGTLWLVANRHLPYEKTLEAAFREVVSLGETAQFKLTAASKPRSPRKG